VDAEEVLREIYATLIRISHDIDVVFPVHPRTRQRLSQLGGARDRSARLHLLDPKGYLEFLAMQQKATVVITDSGGIQEETTYLGVPCLTVRNNTERPVTTTIGTNTLVGTDMKMLEEEVRAILAGKRKKGRIPPLWDGKAAIRIADLLARKSPK
jgi:UDP-N-acetylglucosamine 2-epimerase (non-hydrolysing)